MLCFQDAKDLLFSDFSDTRQVLGWEGPIDAKRFLRTAIKLLKADAALAKLTRTWQSKYIK